MNYDKCSIVISTTYSRDGHAADLSLQPAG